MLVELRRLKRDTSKVSRKAVVEIPKTEEAEKVVDIAPSKRPKKLVGAIGKSPFLYAGAALFILLLVAGYLLWWGKHAPTVPEFTNPTHVTSAIGVEDYPTWSPEGGRLAYQSNQSGNWDIWVTHVGGETPFNRTADYTGDDLFPSWSPDGSQIAFWSSRDGGGYFVMSALKGSPRKVAAKATLRWMGPPQWSSDGNELACVVMDSTGSCAEVEIVSLQRGTPRRLRLKETIHPGWELSWSPDGRFFSYVAAANRNWPTSRLWVMREADGEFFQVTDGKTWNWSPTWSRDGNTLYFISNRGGGVDLWQQRIGDDGSPVGSPHRLTAGLEMSYAKFSSDGTKLAFSKGLVVGNVWRLPIPRRAGLVQRRGLMPSS